MGSHSVNLDNHGQNNLHMLCARFVSPSYFLPSISRRNQESKNNKNHFAETSDEYIYAVLVNFIFGKF